MASSSSNDDDNIIFKIDDVQDVNKDGTLVLYCSCANYEPRFMVTLTGISGALAFEPLPGQDQELLEKKLNDMLSAFHVTETEWKEICRYDRDKEKLVKSHCLVATWRGRDAWSNRTKAIIGLERFFRTNIAEFVVHGTKTTIMDVVLCRLQRSHTYSLPRTLIESGVLLLNDLRDNIVKQTDESVHVGIGWKSIQYEHRDHVFTKFIVADDCLETQNTCDVTQPPDQFLRKLSLVFRRAPYILILDNKDEFAQCIAKLVRQIPTKVSFSFGFGPGLFDGVVVVDRCKPPFFGTDLNQALYLANILDLPVGRIYACTTGAKLVDLLLSTRLMRYYHIWLPDFERTTTDPYQKHLQGGYITKPERGIYKNTLLGELDFKSYYPSLIKEFGLDFDLDNLGYNILPFIVERFIKLRAEASDGKGDILKFVINNLYGTLGYNQSRFYCHRIAEKITEYGRNEMSQRVVPFIETKSDLKIIFVNTDGLLVQYLGLNQDEAAFAQYLDQLAANINEQYGFLRIVRGEIFTALFMFATNVYIGHHATHQKIKGVHAVRHNSPSIMRDITDLYVKIMLDAEMTQKITNFTTQVHALIRDNHKNLDKWAAVFNVDKMYAPNGNYRDPRVQLAVRESLVPGDTITWVNTTEEGPMSLARAKRENLNPSITPYINDIYRCFKYLCDLYTEEPDQVMNMGVFISNTRGLLPAPLKRGTREIDAIFAGADPTVILNKYTCVQCKKLTPNSALTKAFKKRATHTEHITEDDFYNVCVHCQAKRPSHDFSFTHHTNIDLMRVVYHFSSIINFMHLCVSCKDCLAVVSGFYKKHQACIDNHEAIMLKMMSYDTEFFNNARYLFSTNAHNIIAKHSKLLEVKFPDKKTRKRARVL